MYKKLDSMTLLVLVFGVGTLLTGTLQLMLS